MNSLIVKKFYNPFRYIWNKEEELQQQEHQFIKAITSEYVLKSIRDDFNSYVDEVKRAYIYKIS